MPSRISGVKYLVMLLVRTPFSHLIQVSPPSPTFLAYWMYLSTSFLPTSPYSFLTQIPATIPPSERMLWKILYGTSLTTSVSLTHSRPYLMSGLSDPNLSMASRYPMWGKGVFRSVP